MTEVNMCELCENNKMTLECMSCKIGQKLCTSCYKATHYGDNKCMHKIKLLEAPDDIIDSYTKAISLLTMEYFCSGHSKKVLEYVCKSCDCVICCDCLLVGEHKGHDAISFEKACEGIVEKYKECLTKENEQKEKLNELKEIVSQKVKKREEKHKIWIETIENEFKKIIETLQEKQKSILATLEEENQKEFDGYEKMFEEIKTAQNENEKKIQEFQTGISKKISPPMYKESKMRIPEAGKEYDIDLIGPFGNNKKMTINTKTIMDDIENIFKLMSASDSIKLPPMVPK